MNQNRRHRYFVTSLWLFLFCMTFSSCRKSDDDLHQYDPHSPAGPVLIFLDSEGFVYHDAIVPVNSKIKIGWMAQKGSSELVEFSYINQLNYSQRPDEQNTTDLRALGREELFVDSLTYMVPDVAGEYLFTFSLTDKNGITTMKTIRVLVEASPEPSLVDVRTGIVLTGKGNPNEAAYYSIIEGLRFGPFNARANADKIGLVYFNNASGHGIGCPADVVVAGIYNDPDSGINSWQHKKLVNFGRTSLTSEAYRSATLDDIIKACATANATRLEGISARAGENIYAFRTEEGKHGLIRVTMLSGTGSITFDMKVQK